MRHINFDHLACSLVLPEVREAMLPFLGQDIGNPLSRHSFGDKPRAALEEARANIARLINASLSEEIIFTSCGSESNNLAVKGAAIANAKKGRHIIASPIEHHSVSHPLKNLEKQGYKISWLKVDQKGNVSPREVNELIKEDTILITVTSASNEIGTLEPVKEIGKIAREKGVRIAPLIEGGIQENGLRAGIHNLASIVGMGTAARIALEKLNQRQEQLINLREKLIVETLEKTPDCFLTGDRINRLPGHASFCVKFIEGESILLHLNFLGIAGTSGSTCSSEALKVSSVLEAIGIDAIWAQGSAVFCLGIENTIDDVALFVKELPGVVEKLRMMSPLTNAPDLDEFRYREHHHH